MTPTPTRGPATTRVRPSAAALALGTALVALLAGCQDAPGSPVAAAASPSAVADAAAPAPVGSTSTNPDATAEVVPPVEPDARPSGSATPSATAGGGRTAAARTGTTTPGVADRATALPPTAVVEDDARCRATALRVEPIDLQGSPGGTYANFRLVNRSSAACSVRGHVGATLIGDDGKDLRTTVRHSAGPDVWVTVAPGGSAQFHLRFPNPYSGESPCNPPNAARVRVTVPGVAGALTGATPEGGIQACDGKVSTGPLGST